jgi:hypothetical protein
MKTDQVSRRSASYRRVLAATAVLAVSRGIQGVHAGNFPGTCPTGSTAVLGSASGYHQCELVDGYYLRSAGINPAGGTDDAIDIQPVPAGYWSTHASSIVLTTTTTTDVWDGLTDADLGSGNAAATSGVTKCPDNSGTSSTGSTAISACKCDAGYKATTTACAACPDNTDWTTAPSIGAATFCEAIKAGYYGTLGSGADATVLTACPSGWTSAGITSGGPTSIADCFSNTDPPALPPGSSMYGKSGDSNYFYCPTGTVTTGAPAAGTASFCYSLKPGYAGSAGTAGTTGSHATVTGCATGYYIATAANFAAQSSNSDASGLVCTQVPANKYFTTTTSNPLQVTSAEVPTACPFGGTSAAGSSALTACTPDCVTANSNSGAVANGGTCQCAANYYGTPVDTNGASVLAASTGCTACSAGTTSTAGTTSSSGCTAASPTAASPTADSAGASTPIAVALATAAAVPLLL